MSFIFQSRPDRYPLKEKLKPKHRVKWVASRYRDEMKPGARVYFWQSGEAEERGVYGWGHISGVEPELDTEGIYRIEVEYDRSLLDHDSRSHLSAKELKADSTLQDMLILRSPIGTNFVLAEEEDEALREKLREKYGEDWAPSAVMEVQEEGHE